MPQLVLSVVESPFWYSITSVEARGIQPAFGSHVNVPWKLKLPVCSSGYSDYLFFRKESLVFAECAGFGDVFTCLREIPGASHYLTNRFQMEAPVAPSRSLQEGSAKASRRRHGRLHLETIRQIMTSPQLYTRLLSIRSVSHMSTVPMSGVGK